MLTLHNAECFHCVHAIHRDGMKFSVVRMASSIRGKWGELIMAGVINNMFYEQNTQ